jgi:hypothetical protein
VPGGGTQFPVASQTKPEKPVPPVSLVHTNDDDALEQPAA